MRLETNRYSESISITIMLIQRAFSVDLFSLGAVAIMCNELGEVFEAQGRHESAALVYAEAGHQLSEAGHPLSSQLLCHSGLAWKRIGSYLEAEKYYALSLHSLQYLYDTILKSITI
jgi:tetratricopeptide (TPR) repeat protein